jgi:membrane-bound inhibitor of C-type lysozyme
VGIESKKSGNDSNKFVYSKAYLLNIATKKKWVHKTDEFASDKKPSNPDDEFVDEEEIDYKAEYKKLLAKYNKLKNNDI